MICTQYVIKKRRTRLSLCLNTGSLVIDKVTYQKYFMITSRQKVVGSIMFYGVKGINILVEVRQRDFPDLEE
jgi:hypothetical protein